MSDTETYFVDNEPVDYEKYKDFLDPNFQKDFSRHVKQESQTDKRRLEEPTDQHNPFTYGSHFLSQNVNISATGKGSAQTRNISEVFLNRARMNYFLKKNHQRVEDHFKLLPFPDSSDYAVLIR